MTALKEKVVCRDCGEVLHLDEFDGWRFAEWADEGDENGHAPCPLTDEDHAAIGPGIVETLRRRLAAFDAALAAADYPRARAYAGHAYATVSVGSHATVEPDLRDAVAELMYKTRPLRSTGTMPVGTLDSISGSRMWLGFVLSGFDAVDDTWTCACRAVNVTPACVRCGASR